MQFQVQGMTCDGCARRVTKAVQKVDADAAVQVDLAHGVVKVDSTAEAAGIAAAITAAGYPAQSA